MKKFVIIADATCEINKELRERFHIDEVIPTHLITGDGVDHLCDNDWTLFKSPEDFYKLIRNKKGNLSTAPASVEELKEHFTKHLKEGKDIIFLAISSALSGTYNFALMAKKELEEAYPERKIAVIDTLRYSLAIGLLAVSAAKLRDEGKSFDETAEWLEKNKHTLHEMGPMDDLFYLAKKGRVGGFAAFMGTMVGIKPMGDFSRTGLTTILTKAVGVKKAISYSVEYIKRTIINPEEQVLFIAETDRYENAKLLKEAIEKEVKPKEIILVTCGPISGTNIGPGLWSCFYYGKEISENNADELALMKEIAGK